MTLRRAAMALCLSLAACSRAPGPPDGTGTPARGSGQRHLVSLLIPTGPNDRVRSFSLDTWGVDVLAVCHLPPGWRITAGRNASPDGIVAGAGSDGVTWIADPGRLRDLVLIQLEGPVQRSPRGAAPATFRGQARLESGRRLMLDATHVRLTPATRCP